MVNRCERADQKTRENVTRRNMEDWERERERKR